MKSVSETLKMWINRRFIYIVEVLGYTASAIMAAGAIYCLVTYEDVPAHANGSLAPLSKSLTVAEECVVYDWLIDSRGDADAGAPVVRVVTDGQSAQRLCARRYLARAGACLEQAGESADTALRFVHDALEDLDATPCTQTVSAPIRGTVIAHHDSNGTSVLRPETPLGTMYDLEVILGTAVLEASKATKVKEGQETRVTLLGMDEPLVGRVVGQPEARDGGTVQLRFEQVPAGAQRLFREMFEVEPPSFPEVRAEIVVGRRSLFVKLFGRST